MQTTEGAKIEVNDGFYQIKFYNPQVVETTFIPQGETFTVESHAVVASAEEMELLPVVDENQIFLSSPEITVHIQKQPFQISYHYRGQTMLSEKKGYVKNDSLETIEFNLTKDEILYGGGARALGMNRRGHRLKLYNKAHYGYETHSPLMNFTMPLVLSSKMYLVHFDNAPIGYLDLDSNNTNTLTYETISGRKTYQVIAGQTWLDILEAYTGLTGKQPMLPRWALGNFASRFGYRSQEEALKTVKAFKDENIPVDAVILDLYWFGKEVMGTMGNLKFDTDSFPNPTRMIKTLRNQQVETILITEPFILTTSNRWEEAVANSVLAKDSLGKPATFDFFFGNTGLIDLYSSSGYRWFKTINKELLQMGITGIWGDLGEPEEHPSHLIHATGTADEVHNIYGHDWAKLVQEAFHEATPHLRPFILMRAGYSGSQRYGMVPWSGDVKRTWGGLQSQPEISLQMGMQGMAYMHSDLGGFASDNLDDELYVRWLQYGVFQPIFRPHAQEDVPSEPVFRSEKAKALAKKAIELRYRMLPYNYHLVFENHTKGKPLMRPLFFEEPHHPILAEIADTYLWGEHILVSPIVASGVQSQEIYFPKDANWIDFYTGKKYQGGTTQTLTVTEDAIPVFVRTGSFIPLAKTMQSTKEYTGNELEIHYYFDETIEEETEGKLYNDDGITSNAYKNGQYEMLTFEAEKERNNLEIDFEAEWGENYQPTNKTINLYIHNLIEKPKRIKIEGKRALIRYHSEKKRVHVSFTWNTSKEKTITLKLKS